MNKLICCTQVFITPFIKKFISFGVLILLLNHGNCQTLKKTIQAPELSKYGFEIFAEKGEDYGDFITYSSVIIKHNQKNIYVDTSNEYEFSNTLYPLIFKISDSRFELLIEVNSRPNKNYLSLLHIQNDKVIKIDTLPTFLCKGKKLSQGNSIIYAGMWDDSEEWTDKNKQRLTVYNPIMFYKVTDHGISLDTSLTIKRNKLVYGSFKGFQYSEQTPIKVKSLGNKLNMEIRRIKNY